MLIAVEGCCHGELDKIYETIQHAEQQNNMKVDLLLICGDFQAVRNKSDLASMAVPVKYQKLNTFYKYYSGEKVAPVLTIFIGGNHEASNYLQELPYGGWVAPSIYYMGYAGVVNFGGLRIGGLSGIFKGQDYHRGHFECPPYNESTKRSVYHVRSLEVFRLKQLRQTLDIFMSHDWPRGIYEYGSINELLRRKRFLADEVSTGSLGSPAAEELLYALKPDYWFAAHLHVKFPALVEFEIDNGKTKSTKFLALDKCLPGRQFLQILDMNPREDETKELRLDAEWLSILRSTNHLLSVSRTNSYMPGIGSNERFDFTVTKDELEEICSDFGGNLRLPDNFVQTAAPHNAAPGKGADVCERTATRVNAQTTLLCEMVGLSNPVALLLNRGNNNASGLQPADNSAADNGDLVNSTFASSGSFNPDEISLDDCENDAEAPDREDDPPCPDVRRSASGISDPGEILLGKPEEKAPSDEDYESFSPQVKRQSLDPQQDRRTSLEETGNCVKDPETEPEISSPPGGKEDETVISPPISESTPKIFKRRNQAIYASRDDGPE